MSLEAILRAKVTFSSPLQRDRAFLSPLSVSLEGAGLWCRNRVTLPAGHSMGACVPSTLRVAWWGSRA